MKTSVSDPWSIEFPVHANGDEAKDHCSENFFEDSFVSNTSYLLNLERLPDSEQYLARLYSRLKAVQSGTSKRDLINSLSNAKEDCIARLISAGRNFETSEEKELAANPLIRQIAPHLQALTANELVHLLKADVLQQVIDDDNNQSTETVDEKKID